MAPDRVKHHLRTPPKRRRILTQEPYNKNDLKIVNGPVHGDRFTIRNGYAYQHSAEFFQPPGPDVKCPIRRRPLKLTLGDLECARVLGQGEFGKVLLVRTTRKSHEYDLLESYFALKVYDKKYIRAVENSSSRSEKNVERRFLKKLDWSPFVNGVVDVFHDARNIYMMLEYIPCGTLRSIIHDRAPLDATRATFYFANIVCGLKFLEQNDIVHRDLKPENILLGADGYLALSDFGTAIKPADDGQSIIDWAMVGSPRYMAPECINPSVIGPVSYGSMVDWWSSGCIYFELLTGEPAFSAPDDNVRATLKKVLFGGIDWPAHLGIGKDLKSLVESFLVKDPFKRLGFNGIDEVLNHDYFRKIDWDKFENRLYMAPYVPPSPRAADQWHKYPLPRQSQIPGLRISEPAIHLAHDARFSLRCRP